LGKIKQAIVGFRIRILKIIAMDTDAVRLFVAAAEKLNISAAGRSLGLSPAVASARLAKLERELDAELLHRSTRKVTLSLQGVEFLAYARELIAQEDAALSALGLGQATVTGTLRFAAPSSFAQQYIAPLLPEFLAMHASLSLDLRLSDTPFDLIEGSFDLALRNSAPQDSSFKGRKLADDKRLLCASPGYLEAHGRPQHPEDLEQHQLIAFREQTRRRLSGHADHSGYFDPRKAGCRLTIDDGASQKLATIAGAGISINSLWSVHRELANGSLEQVLPEYQIEDCSVLWLVYPSSNVLTAKVRVFIDFLMERIGQSPGWLA
jgi:DNA-binding transcriptional LysR family regulator